MLDISRIYCGNITSSEELRYKKYNQFLPLHTQKRPIVVWNITNSCNLSCEHCYANANEDLTDKELTTKEAKNVIDKLAEFKIPVILFSGGEPMMRHDILELIAYTRFKKIRAVVSTNGVLIDKKKANELKQSDISYVGVSIDGSKSIHDKFRGIDGAFESTLTGIKNCVNAGIKVGLRFTIFQGNYKEIPFLFDLMERENIERICFYHLVCSGRGQSMKDSELSIDEKRNVMDLIIDKTKEFYSKNIKKEILTVANHCDAVYLYKKMVKENHPNSEIALNLLNLNKSASSGIGISSINWDGTVYPDQFWRNKSLGNIKDSSFEDIWLNPNNEFLRKLRNKKDFITGRCRNCNYFDICLGNFRPRAEELTGNLWASDPGCYLYDNEICFNPGVKDL